ncbi:MAG: site-specific integrase, partial [Candidatus Nitrosocosmicus sp.]|nr:site-specific integrase [Candidatus Nitrosocosmicus sp.]
MGSNPTPRAIIVDSYEDLISVKKDKSNDNLQNLSQSQSNSSNQKAEVLIELITSICKYQKPFIRKSLDRLLEISFENTETICKYIIAEQNEINIKESTKEGKIKVLVDLVKFLDYKDLKKVTKEDIFSYLNRYRKPEEADPQHRWIGTWNNRHLILLKFFRWLYDPDNSDIKNRKSPKCMNGIKRLTRREVSRYKPSDLWTAKECEVFLKYCPSKRDRAFISMAIDTSCRPSELLNLRLEDIQFKANSNGTKQYAETTINGKTGQRTVPLINSLPYIKEWILDHPSPSNPKEWIFISEGNTSFGKKITRDGLLKHFQEFYRDNYYPKLVNSPNIPDSDKSFIKSILTKPINLYIFRHIALTEKSKILNEHMLRNHAGWSTTSKMPQVYIHHLGGASSKQLLQSFGIIEKENNDEGLNQKKIIICPNCSEPNFRSENKFCFKCKIVLSLTSYNEARNEDKQIIENLQTDVESLKEGISKIMRLIQLNPVVANIKPEILR